MVARQGRDRREALEETGDTGATLGRWMRERLVRPAGMTLGRRTRRHLRRGIPGRRLAAPPHHPERAEGRGGRRQRAGVSGDGEDGGSRRKRQVVTRHDSYV